VTDLDPVMVGEALLGAGGAEKFQGPHGARLGGLLTLAASRRSRNSATASISSTATFSYVFGTLERFEML
jgi:hypothetical protein